MSDPALARTVTVGDLAIGNDRRFVLIAGPCQIESEAHAIEVADALAAMTAAAGIGLIYKSSYDKANRTSVKAERGMGLDAALKIFQEIKKEFGVPVVTDVHLPDQCAAVAEAVDVLQIPAFLCRQTDLLLAAGETGKVVNVKKGQFLAPWDMKNVAAKVASTGNDNVMLCERGVTFGYNTLVNDMRALPQMAETGYPVVFDATHSVQQPGGKGTATGGDRAMVPYVARAAIATGCVAALFMEVHDDPDNAPSDGPNMVRIEDLTGVLKTLKAIDSIVKSDTAGA